MSQGPETLGATGAAALTQQPLPPPPLFRPIGRCRDRQHVNPHLPVRATIAEADVVLGMDVMTRQVHLVFGRDKLAELAASGNEKKVCLLVVSSTTTRRNWRSLAS
jgi:hypothetical protein